MNLWLTWGNQVPLCSSKWWHFCVSVENEYMRQLEFPHPNGNIKISFDQGLWMRNWDWRGELSSEHVFMKLRKCFAEVRPVKNGLHFWSLDVSLYLAQTWWWSCGQLRTATLLILTPNLHCTPTVLETVSGSVLIKKPSLTSNSSRASILSGKPSSTFPAHLQAARWAWWGLWCGSVFF